ncbi:uncharacterized protein LOC106380337 [Brassica napus]|uniref:uncharacterized protein LOC106380337 n=1 Tax=Brassica napus TaxID=3708 RepID=UPI0020785125|nr:uncharacterized protein LOC106380337 [Brassica napus]
MASNIPAGVPMVKWVHTYLLRNGNFWSTKENTSLGSWIWRKLLKYRDKAKVFHRMEVRNGRSTSFCWAQGFIDMGIRAMASVASAFSRRKRNHRVDVFNQIEVALENQRLKAVDAEDIPLWQQKQGTYKNLFNTNKTWQLIRQASPIVYWHTGVWFQHATPKSAFCTWLALHNRLTTGDRMLTWNSSIDPAWSDFWRDLFFKQPFTLSGGKGMKDVMAQTPCLLHCWSDLLIAK